MRLTPRSGNYSERKRNKMKDQLAKIRAEALSAFEGVQNAARLDALRVKYLGKKGELTGVPGKK